MSFYGQIIQQVPPGALQEITIKANSEAEQKSTIKRSFTLQGDDFIQPSVVDADNITVTLNHNTKSEQTNNNVQILCYDSTNQCYRNGTASIDAAGHIIITIGKEKMPLLSCSADPEGNITIA